MSVKLIPLYQQFNCNTGADPGFFLTEAQKPRSQGEIMLVSYVSIMKFSRLVTKMVFFLPN